MIQGKPLLSVKDLRVTYQIGDSNWFGRRSSFDAVQSVSFEIAAGETLALVGESGCGKSTTGRAILGLVTPSGGRISLLGEDIGGLSQRALRQHRQHMSMVFQDPGSSLNPRMSVEATIGEVVSSQRLARNGSESRRLVEDVAELVGLTSQQLSRYPHELSGGQRQRVGIARAIVSRPALVVCDEPTASLDVSIQAQVLNVLKDIQDELNVSYLFISHDLATVRFMSDRIAVMYMGRIVETAGREKLVSEPTHPYTKMLLNSVYDPTTSDRSDDAPVSGEVPSLALPPSGCAFHTRCPDVMEVCRTTRPEDYGTSASDFAACHLGAPGVAEVAMSAANRVQP